MTARKAALFAILAASAAPVMSAPLDKELCKVLKLDYEHLAKSPLRDDMEKGPEWAKANLPAERLKEIESFIALEEKLNFRCPQSKLVPSPPKAASAGSKEEKAAPAGAGTPNAPSKKAAEPAKSKATAAPTQKKKAGTAETRAN